jgi:hypothetical protein
MDNTWFVSISCSVIAAVIVAVVAKVFKPRWKIAIFSIFVSTVLFIFGSILQVAVQIVFEPDNPAWAIIPILLKDHTNIVLFLLFVLNLIPGIITGVGCSIGRSLNQHILYAIVSAIVSLSICDTIFFFYTRRSYLQSEIPEIKVYADFGFYYFSLLSNVLGGPVAGILIGYLTHLASQQKTRQDEASRFC